ncbi:UNVERIFIED_CONTAM: hypothetical protein Sradi_3428700 [Sesamum radiatum]|uniref:Uncharacterized protein n=1 Tax=Sesamum radiatum TaxID=300843 RepID=A0AAW2R504_SESRA
MEAIGRYQHVEKDLKKPYKEAAGQAEEVRKVADQARLNFPNTDKGHRYLEAYYASHLLKYEKSMGFQQEVAKIAEHFLEDGFLVRNISWLRATEVPTFLSFDATVDSAPNPFANSSAPATQSPSD